MAETDEKLTIYLTLTSKEGSPRVPLEIPKSISTSDLLSSISTETKIPTPKVIFRGRLVKAGTADAVAEFKLEEGSVLHCMGKPVDASATETTPAVAITAGSLPQVSLGGLPTPAAPSVPSPASAVGGSTGPLPTALAQLKAQNPPATYQTAVTTLQKLLTNITDHPMEEKFRRIKKSNSAFQNRLGSLPGAREAILACGFTETNETYEMQATAEAWPALVEAVRVVQAASTTATAPAFPPSFPGIPPGGGFPGMPGGGGLPANIPPHMQEAMRSMLSDPAQLQRMLQDPMVQSMLQGHPEAQQMMQQMQNMPPDQLAQMSQLLASQAAAGGGMFPGGAGAAGGGLIPGGGAAAPAPPANDSSQTEEEMIAEAIRRSLDDQGNNNNNNGGGGSS